MNILLFIIGIVLIIISVVKLFLNLKNDVDCDQEPELPDFEDDKKWEDRKGLRTVSREKRNLSMIIRAHVAECVKPAQPKAKSVIIMRWNMKCPFCKKHLKPINKAQKEEWICDNDGCPANKKLSTLAYVEFYGNTQEEIDSLYE